MTINHLNISSTGKKEYRTQKFHLSAFVLPINVTGVADRTSTIIANVTLEHMRLISDDGYLEKVFDKMTLRAQREEKRKILKKQEYQI